MTAPQKIVLTLPVACKIRDQQPQQSERVDFQQVANSALGMNGTNPLRMQERHGGAQKARSAAAANQRHGQKPLIL